MMKLSFVFILFFIALNVVSCAGPQSSDSSLLIPTIYYKPTIHQNKNKCASNALKDVIDPEGKRLTTLCESDYKQCLRQGSCFVESDEELISYNYHSTKEGLPRFVIVDLKKCPYGYGVRDSCLDPYFSVAADLSIYKPGDVIFIPRLVGAVMPNGEIHDGYLVIRDAGGGVTGASRFDFFTGFLDHHQKANVMARLGLGDPQNRFEFRVATQEEAAAARERRNYPSLKKELLEAGLK